MINVLLRYDRITTIPLGEFHGSTLPRHPRRGQYVPLVVSCIQRNPTSNATWLVSVSRADRVSRTPFGKSTWGVESLR